MVGTSCAPGRYGCHEGLAGTTKTAANGAKVKTSAAGTSEGIAAEESEEINGEIPAGGRKSYILIVNGQQHKASKKLLRTVGGPFSPERQLS